MEKSFINRITCEEVPYAIHKITNLDDLLFSKGMGRVYVYSPLNYYVESFEEVLVEEITALTDRTYQSARCKKRVADLIYALTALGASRLVEQHNTTAATGRTFHVGIHSDWSRVELLRSHIFG